MKAIFINPFMKASFKVLENMANIKAERGSPSLKLSPLTQYEVVVIISVNGDIKGKVIYGMSEETAKKIVSQTMMGIPVERLDEMEKSIIKEIANRITTEAKDLLKLEGYNCVLTPPTIFIKENLKISLEGDQILLIPLFTPYGNIEINVFLKEKE
jgi:chemotaxis protein CheX